MTDNVNLTTDELTYVIGGIGILLDMDRTPEFAVKELASARIKLANLLVEAASHSKPREEARDIVDLLLAYDYRE